MFRLRQYGIEMATQNHDVHLDVSTCLLNPKPVKILSENKNLANDKQIWLLLAEKELSTLTKRYLQYFRS